MNITNLDKVKGAMRSTSGEEEKPNPLQYEYELQRYISQLAELDIVCDLTSDIRRLEAILKSVEESKTLLSADKIDKIHKLADSIHKMKVSKHKMDKHAENFVSIHRLRQIMIHISSVVDKQVKDPVAKQKIRDEFNKLVR